MATLKNLDVPFSDSVLENKASQLIRRYALQRRWVPALPIPIESIMEHTLNLLIEYSAIEEPESVKIWGCISPSTKIITLNEHHLDDFQRNPGLERYTLAHEIGHWTMHVDAVDQQSLFGPPQETIVCRDGDQRVCEQVANRFAAFLLMPRDLLLKDLPSFAVAAKLGFRDLASKAGVSNTALGYRLDSLSIPHA